MRLTHALYHTALALLEDPDPDRLHWGTDLSRRSGVQPGALHPILGRLLEAGWLTDSWEDPGEGLRVGRPLRRYYRVTDAGRTELAALLERARADRRFQNI